MAEENGNKITLNIDGREVTVAKGTTVLEAALGAGIDVPYFCWHPKLDSIGACRMCLVEIEKIPKPAVSCATQAMDGMVVHTNNEKIIKARKGVIEFILLNHPLDCPTCDKGGECDLQDITFGHGIDKSRYDFPKLRVIDGAKTTFDDKRIGPEIVRNMNRCITCFRCVRFNKEIAGEYDLGAYHRGNHTVIDAAPGEQVDNLYSGNNVEICPVGALTNTDWRYKVRVWLTQKKESVCSHCADGCNLTLWRDHRTIFRATSRRNDDIDEGWICDVGRYGYQYGNHENRLTKPLIKKEGKQVEASWDEAIKRICDQFQSIKDKKGGLCIAGLAGGNLTTETYYFLNRFFRQGIRSNSVDYRLEHIFLKDSPDGDPYRTLFNAPFKIAALEEADLIFIFDSNIMKEHPITNLRVRKAWFKNKATVLTANPVETKTGEIAQDELVFTPDTDAAFLAALLHAIVDNNLYKMDKGRVQELKDKLAPSSLDEAAKVCGIDKERIVRLARALASARKPYILAGEFLKRSAHRQLLSGGVYNLANLLDLADGQAVVLATHANSKGAEITGFRPDLTADQVRTLSEMWGEAMPENPGASTSKTFKAASDEEMDAIFIVGANPVMRYPDRVFVEAALSRLDFLVVADLYETATTQIADVVLPLASWSEQAGSFVNHEGRYQRFEKAGNAPDGVRTGIEMIRAIASELNLDIDLSDREMTEQAKRVIDAWNGPARDRDRFFELKQPAVTTDDNYPYRLYIGNDLHHFGHYTEHCESLLRFTSEPYVEMSDELVHKLGIEEGALVRVESKAGKLILKVKCSEFLEAETLFVPNNFAATDVNTLVTPDGMTRVRIEKLDDQ